MSDNIKIFALVFALVLTILLGAGYERPAKPVIIQNPALTAQAIEEITPRPVWEF